MRISKATAHHTKHAIHVLQMFFIEEIQELPQRLGFVKIKLIQESPPL